MEDAFHRLLGVIDQSPGIDVDELCGAVVAQLLEREPRDDVAILAIGTAREAADRWELTIDAERSAVAGVRRGLARWLASAGVEASVIDDIVLACSEACGNSVEHAYGLRDGRIGIEAGLTDGELLLVVRDSGRWRPARGTYRGRGMLIVSECMDSVAVNRDEGGTVLTMRRSLRAKAE